MNIRKLIKMLETETDKEKMDKLIQKINSVMIKKGCTQNEQFWLSAPA